MEKLTLRELREKRALSVTELARLSQTSTSIIWGIEAAVSIPRPRVRRRLAAALGVEPDAIAWPQERRPVSVTCAYCGATVDAAAVAAHLTQHLGTAPIVVDVMDFVPRLVRHVIAADGQTAVEDAVPQPPERLLVAAVRQAGGALNRSGIYPASPALLRWVARRAPQWVARRAGAMTHPLTSRYDSDIIPSEVRREDSNG